MQGLFFVVMPGIKVLGRPLPNRNNLRLVYNCNGVSSFFVTNVIAASLHYSGVFRMSQLMDNLGTLVCVSMVVGTCLQ